jgi:formate C-acetyltransferase
LINVGGLKTDGTNGVNDLSYLILDVIEEIFASLGLAPLGPV